MPNPYAKYLPQSGGSVIDTGPDYKAQSNARDDAKLAVEVQNLKLNQARADRENQDDAQKQAKLDAARQTAVAQVKRVIGSLDDVATDANDNGGWFETGRSGALVRSLPTFVQAGTAAYDLENKIKAINASAAIEALNQMRAQSPTGGGVGNVSEGEYPLLAASNQGVVLDPNTGHDTFMTSAANAKAAWLDQLRRIDPKSAAEFDNKPGVWADKNGRWFIGSPHPNSQKPTSTPGSTQHPPDIDAIMKKYGH